MKSNIEENIRKIMDLHEKIILFRENDVHFESIFRAVIERAGGHIITMENGMDSFSGGV